VRALLLASSLVFATLVTTSASAQSTVAPTATTSHAPTTNAPLSPAEKAATQVVDSFMVDIATSQFEAARQLMTPDAVVLANAQVLGNRDAYIAGPAKRDAAALGATTQRELLHRNVKVGADLACVVSEKRLHGTPPGAQAALDILVTETMLLSRTSSGWKIAHIHWSTRQVG
jgi:ketosteroid isomerase-like protein